MKEQGKAKKILCIVIAVIIIIGAVICGTKGFNMEQVYSSREQMVISNNTGLDESKIEEIANSVLNRKVTVKKVERFGSSVQIMSDTISEEEKENIINKVNEEYSIEIQKDDIKVTKISNTRIRDIIKPYILPGIATLAAVLLYWGIIYHKIGINKILLKGMGMPIFTLLTYYALVAITRAPFGRVVNSIAIGLYIASIVWVTVCFQKEKLTIKKEND